MSNTGIRGISASKKFLFSIAYVLLTTSLLWSGKIDGAQWVDATSLVTGALLVAQAYQDAQK